MEKLIQIVNYLLIVPFVVSYITHFNVSININDYVGHFIITLVLVALMFHFGFYILIIVLGYIVCDYIYFKIFNDGKTRG